MDGVENDKDVADQINGKAEQGAEKKGNPN